MKDFELAVFYAIAVTGVISGMAKGSNQCALGLRFYEEIRSYFYEESKDFVHSELVAMEKKMGLPTTLSEINIPICEETMNTFVNRLCASDVIDDSSNESKVRIRKAMLSVYK